MASNYSSTELFGTGSLLKENFTAGTEYKISLQKTEVSASTISNTYLMMETLTFTTPALPLYFSGSSYSGSNVYGGQTDNYTQGIYVPSEGVSEIRWTPAINVTGANVHFKATGLISASISGGSYVFANRAQLRTAVDLWISDNTAALATYGQINTWDVSAITDMASLFLAKNTFNSDISNWDVSSVTDMRNMFANTNTFNQPIGNWVVSSVTNMDSMFFGANAFNSNINDWDVSSVTNMGGMFAGAFAFQSPLNLWEVDSLTNADQFMGLTGNDNAITYTLLDELYNGWVVDIAAMQSGVTISFGDSKFTSAGLAAKNILAGAPLNWTITDGGQV